MRELSIIWINVLFPSLVTPMATRTEENREIATMTAQIETMKEALIGALEPKTVYAGEDGVNIWEKPDTGSIVLS